MLRFLKGFFKPKHSNVTPMPEAPYKVEAPTPVTPAVVNPEMFPQIFVDGHGDVQETKTKPKKAPAKKSAPKKPAAIKVPAKPRAPRKPKAK